MDIGNKGVKGTTTCRAPGFVYFPYNLMFLYSKHSRDGDGARLSVCQRGTVGGVEAAAWRTIF